MSQISIILAVYNMQNYIQNALHSCLNQSFKDIEIIVVDDKSIDKSLDIAKSCAKNDKRIKIIQNHTNLGTFASRNIGVLNASSKYIMFLDADDFLENNACELALKYMKNNHDLICFDAFVHRVKTKKFYRYKQNMSLNQEQFCDFLLEQRHFCWSVWAKVFNKNLIVDNFHLFYTKDKLCYGEDIYFCYVYFLLCKNIFISKDCIYHYEFNENGRYENKNIEILKQNYTHKIKSYKFIKEKSKLFGNKILNERLFFQLKKEIKDLKSRILKAPNHQQQL